MKDLKKDYKVSKYAWTRLNSVEEAEENTKALESVSNISHTNEEKKGSNQE